MNSQMILDKKIVAALRYDSPPVAENGKIIEHGKNPNDRHYIVQDLHPQAPTGFGLRVNKTSKSYILRIRDGTKVKTITIGRHPDLLIGNSVPPERNARLLAAEVSARIRRGEDVNAGKKAARIKKELPTLRELFDVYIEDYKNNIKHRVRENTLTAISKAMKRLGDELLDRPAADVTWKDIDTFFQRVAGTEKHQTAAEQTIRWVSTVYNKANDRALLNALQDGKDPDQLRNPAAIFSKTGKIRTRGELERDYAKKGVRNPLSKSETGFKLWLDFVLDARNRPSARTAAEYFLVTLMIGARRSETNTLQWYEGETVTGSHSDANYVDLKRREFRLYITKPDRPLILPIPDFIYALLIERRRQYPDSRYVFSAVSTSPLRKTEHYSDSRSFMESVRKNTGVLFATHDLRRTFGNVVNHMAIPSLLAKQLLNHKSTDVTSLYTDLSVEQLLEYMNKIERRILSYASNNPLNDLKNDAS